MFRRTALKLVSLAPPQYQLAAQQFAKFLVTGTVGATVDFTIYNVLTRGFDWTVTYTIFGFDIIAANLVSVFLAIMSNFILNKYWTFRNNEKAVAKQWSGYFALNLFTFILNQLIVSFLTFQVPFMTVIFKGLKDNAAKVIAIGFILFINFLGSKFLVFRKKEPVAPVEIA